MSNWWLAVGLTALSLLVSLGIYLLAYVHGKRAGQRERCGRHSHAERVAAERLEPPNDGAGPPGRVSSADFRNSVIWEGEEHSQY